jgi:hypothetical protein
VPWSSGDAPTCWCTSAAPQVLKKPASRPQVGDLLTEIKGEIDKVDLVERLSRMPELRPMEDKYLDAALLSYTRPVAAHHGHFTVRPEAATEEVRLSHRISLCVSLTVSLSLSLSLSLALPPSPSLILCLILCFPHCVSHCVSNASLSLSLSRLSFCVPRASLRR